jgi:hypothetical protein
VQSSLGSLPHTYYGAPGDIWTEVTIPTDPADTHVAFALNFFNKTATRIPEAFFLRFNTSATFKGSPGAPAWYVSKLNETVWPQDVQLGGNIHHHGNDGVIGATIADPAGASANATLRIFSRHAGVACFGHPTGFPVPLTSTPDPAEGGAFMLIDNIWGELSLVLADRFYAVLLLMSPRVLPVALALSHTGTNYPQWIPVSGEQCVMR